MASRRLISLPSILDLEREAERTGQQRRLSASRRQYASAQAQIEMAQQRMAYAALAIVRPDDFHEIDSERRQTVARANYEAKEKARAFFTDECIGLVSEQ